MTSPSELAVDHQMAAEDDEDTLERMPDPASSLLTDNPQPVAPVAAWDPGATVMASPADEPEVAGQDDADESMTLSGPDAELESISESPAVSAAASQSTSWHDIQVTFVDDPRSLSKWRPVSSTTAAKRSSRSSRSSKIRCKPPGMAKTREPRNCALPSSITVRSEPVSQISPAKPEPPGACAYRRRADGGRRQRHRAAAHVLCAAARCRGFVVKGMVWRSHPGPVPVQREDQYLWLR